MPALTPDRFILEEHAVTHAVTTTPHAPDRTHWISEAGGLTQFGAFIEELQPGSRTALKHWHSDEDELVYVLDGEITLIEGDTVTPLRAGDAATFRAGVAVGHFLENRSRLPSRCFVVGTRAAVDRITYPDHQRICLRDRSLPDDLWTDLQGRPADSPYR